MNFVIPLMIGELGLVRSGDDLLSGDRRLDLSDVHCGVGDDDGLPLRPFAD